MINGLRLRSRGPQQGPEISDLGPFRVSEAGVSINDTNPKPLLAELQLLIHGDVDLSNDEVAAVRELARFVGKRMKIIIECLGELDVGARALEIEFRVEP